MVGMIRSTAYRDIVERIDDGVALLDGEGRVVYLNPAAERILGTSLEAVSHRRVEDVTPEAIGTAFRLARSRVMAGEKVHLLRSYFAHGAWYEVVARPTSEGSLLVFCDVTDRLQAECARHSVERRFQLLVDGVKEYAIILLDVNGRVVTWNEGAERITQYRADEIVGRNISAFYPPEEPGADKAVQALEGAVARGRYVEEGWRVRKDGSRYWASSVITPLYDELRQPCGFAKIVRDVSERRRTEMVLRTSEERLRLAAEAGKIGMIDYDPSTGVVIWDRRCKELLGLPPDEEIDYARWLSSVHPEDRPRVEAAIARALRPESGGELEDEYRTTEVNGEDHWIAVRGKVSFDEARRPVHFFGTMRDVSDQHHLDELRDRLSALFAHDLRSPLSAIRLAGTRLEDESAETEKAASAPSATEALIKVILRSADRMTRMIEELLDFTRVRLGEGMPLQRERVDLIALARQLCAEAELAHPGHHVTCTFRGDLVGMWDRSQLERVVANLVDNAVHYGRSDSPVEVSMRGEGPAVALAVHNEGAPISPDILPVIFDPFRRGKPGPQAHAGTAAGLGLGLFIARALVMAHGGAIEVRSTAEDGTTFTARLPRGLPRTAAPQPTA